MAVKTTLLKTSLMALRVLEFLISGLILGIYSYFLSVLADRKLPIYNPERAVEGITGAACLFTICGFLFTCCFGGNFFLSGLALFLDICFVIAFIAVAVITRGGGTNNCSDGSYIITPVGSGIVGQTSQLSGFGSSGFGENGQGTANVVAGPTFRYACNLEKAAFAVAVIGAFFFLFSAVLTFMLARSAKREKRFGPSPANNYTTGSGRRTFSQRLGLRRNRGAKKTRDAEAGDELAMTGAVADEKHHHHAHNNGMTTGTTNGMTSGTTGGVNGTNGTHGTNGVDETFNKNGYDRAPILTSHKV